MHRFRVAAAAATAAVLLLAGCSASDGSEQAASSETLRLGLFVPPTSFEAKSVNWGNESPYVQAVYDTLLISAPDGSPEPHLATSWEYNDDNTVLTLELRDDVVFTDGEAFTADVAAQNLLRFRDGTSSNAAYGQSIADAVAVDDDTLEITLSAPDPALLGYLAFNLGAQASPASFDASDAQTNPVGSGPYILDVDQTVAGSSYHFTANPDYWVPEMQNYDEITMLVYQDSNAMLAAIQAGEIDAANLANNDSLTQVESAGFTVSTWEQSWYGLFLFDRAGTMNPALADVRVRQAINFAFDAEGMLQAAGGGYGTQTGQIFPERSAAFDPALDDVYAYDPDKARELLDEAGYGDGLTIEMPSAAYFPSSVLALVQQQLADVGITVNYTDTGNNFIADILAPKYPVTLMQLQQDADWALINFSLAPGATFNPAHFEDPTVNELIDVVHFGTQEEADAAVAELNAYIVEQAWFAPWFRVQSSFATNADTQVTVQTDNAVPWLWNIAPAA
ncbi:ABC transporter substrate-binding protein [Agromyces atrinae]|uniref:ABC transporter substrate-binding protein n=1 Tax=Agromyces atrinae TaxID=592376 RepID=UPI001F58B68B|nr:ABC transporter substrate-binding protein [Agromyces atrinae]MCI2959475.1 ABC transporter substrate-binding protein [Agromyces atrinae]